MDIINIYILYTVYEYEYARSEIITIKAYGTTV